MVKLGRTGNLETLLIIELLTSTVTGQKDDVHIFFTLGGHQDAHERKPFGQMNPQFNRMQRNDFSNILSQTQEQEQLFPPSSWINPHPLAETEPEQWSHKEQKDVDDSHVFFNFQDTQNADQMNLQSNKKLMGPPSNQNFREELARRFQPEEIADEMTPQSNKKLIGPLSSQNFRRELARRFQQGEEDFNRKWMPKTTISSTNPGERGQIKSNRANVQEGILSKLTAVENVLQELKEEVRNGKNKNGKAEDYPNLTPKLNLNRGFVFGDMNSFSRKEKNQTNHKQQNEGKNTPNKNVTGKINQQSEKMESVLKKGYIPTNQTKSNKSNLKVPFKEVFHKSEAQSDENFKASIGKNKTGAAQAKQSLASPNLIKKVKSE